MSDLIVNATDDSFEKEINGAQPILVDFWAEWCGPCKMMEPNLKAFAAERQGAVKVVKVNIEECPQVASRFGIRSIPTLMAFKDGEPLATQTGALNKGQLDRWFDAQK